MTTEIRKQHITEQLDKILEEINDVGTVRGYQIDPDNTHWLYKVGFRDAAMYIHNLIEKRVLNLKL